MKRDITSVLTMRQIEEHPAATPELVEQLYDCIKGFCNGKNETYVSLPDLYYSAGLTDRVGGYCFIRLLVQNRINPTWYDHGKNEPVRIVLL